MAAPIKTFVFCLNRSLLNGRIGIHKTVLQFPNSKIVRCYSDTDNQNKNKPKLDLAKPGKQREKQDQTIKKEKKQTPPKFADVNKDLEADLVNAVESVAQSLKGDQDQVASDLVKKLRDNKKLTEYQKHKGPQTPRNREPFNIENERRWARWNAGFNDSLSKKRGFAAKLANEHWQQSQDQNYIENESGRNRRYKPKEKGPHGWNPRKDTTQGGQSVLSQIRSVEWHQGVSRIDMTTDRVKPREKRQQTGRAFPALFEGTGLGIFTKPVSAETTELKVQEKPSVFDILEAEETNQKLVLPPTNAFEEEIRWTKEGKMWKFPVDNEEGMEEEAKVGFHEHVFLDHLLEGFPDKGPVRIFMELVTVGLSKNPYLTVEQKKEHIDWFKEYFSDKYHLIDDTDDDKVTESQQQKELQT